MSLGRCKSPASGKRLASGAPYDSPQWHTITLQLVFPKPCTTAVSPCEQYNVFVTVLSDCWYAIALSQVTISIGKSRAQWRLHPLQARCHRACPLGLPSQPCTNSILEIQLALYSSSVHLLSAHSSKPHHNIRLL